MLLTVVPLAVALVTVPLEQGETKDSVAITENIERISIAASVATTRVSPLRITDIDEKQIFRISAGSTFPELVRNVPGVYASSETGSYGDAKINIRGFKQENISILLNGVPISGLTSGSMYWNNWAGLTASTASIQIQKGVGNSMLSENSVGGTVNIVTTQPSPEPYCQAQYMVTSYGANAAAIGVNSGAMKGGWSFSILGSHDWGHSYVDCSGINSWAYYAVVTKRFNERHSLNLTMLGSPESHSQRSQRISYDEMERYGIGYNKSWGWYTGSDGNTVKRTISRNNYFKPYFMLTHSYDGRYAERRGIQVFTTAYASTASGGGYYTESTGRRIASFVVPEGEYGEGQIDWKGVYDYNASGKSTTYGIQANNIMSDYLAGHTQIGVKSSILYDFGKRARLDAGLHYQFYGTWEKEQITDLLGADYWYEDYAGQSLAGQDGRSSIKHVGDYIRTDNGREQHYATLYALGTFKLGTGMQTILTVGGSFSGTALRRWDAYNYVSGERYSDFTGKTGGSVKAGVLHNISRSSTIYANCAFYSRVPYANVFFASGSNSVSKDIVNEKNYLGEIGYRLVRSSFSTEITTYVSYWQDKTLTTPSYRSLDEDPYKYMVSGLDALHYGIEASASYRFSHTFLLEAFASIGDWEWKNDVEAILYDPVTMRPAGEINVYADGLHVGDAPQTQIGAILTITLPKGISIRTDWNFNDRLWADFDPVTRTDPDVRCDSYRLPSYHLLNIGATWDRSFGKWAISVFANVRNVTDTVYVERSKDGATHDRDTFTGYWGNGASFNFGIRIRY